MAASTTHRKTLLGTALVLTAALLAPVVLEGTAEAQGPRRRTVAAESSVLRTADVPAAAAPTPARVHYGYNELYVPTYFRPINGAYDLIVHFHGVPFLQEDNIEASKINAIVVSINLGNGSGPYSSAYSIPGAFDKLLDATQAALDKTGRAPGAHVGRIALSAWSAGFGAVGAILSHPGNEDRVDAVLLADGLHTNYLGNGVINDAPLVKYVNFAKLAMHGKKLFALTHSSIMTNGYASTTKTIGTLLGMTGVERESAPYVGARGMQEIYESHKGSFHVKGYEGINESAHIDHVKAMNSTLFPYLKLRWR